MNGLCLGSCSPFYVCWYQNIYMFLSAIFLGFLGAAGGGWRCCRFLFVAVNALDLRHGVFHMTIYSCVGVLAYITSG